MSEPERRNIASVEDADDNGNTIEGTATYAAPDPEPIKEKSNTSKARKEKEKSRMESTSPTKAASTDSDLTVHPNPERKESIRRGKDPERPEQKREKVRQNDMPTRPAPKHSSATPAIPAPRRERRDVDPFYYGAQPGMVTPATSRPRAHTTRPNSYYGPSANAHFYGQATPAYIPHPTAMHYPAALPTSYPPQMWAPAPMPLRPRPVIQQERMARPLEARFGPIPARPHSAMGHQGMHQIEYDAYDPPEVHKALMRQGSSASRRIKRDGSMGPPARPASARPPSSQVYRTPTTPLVRRVVGFEDDDLDGHTDLFQDISPMATATHEHPQRGSISTRPLLYDRGDYRTEVATRHSRRNSYHYHDQTPGGSYEEKLKQAAAYQEDIDGTSLPLTAESLRNARRHGAHSRSIASRDESDYRRSAMTRTTRSGGESEDYTITVKGPTTVKVGGAEMVCQDGAEISITKPGYRGGSDESSYADQDDRKARYDRIGPAPSRRATSQAGTLSRGVYSGHEHGNPFVPHMYDSCMHGGFVPQYPPYPGSRDGFI